MSIEIKLLDDIIDIKSAIVLAEEVFMQFEAPIYTEAGVESFRDFLYGNGMKIRISQKNMVFWGAYTKENILAGMCAIRNSKHISLLFVHSDFHRQGIGRMLVHKAIEHIESCGEQLITLNSSPYGLLFYKKIGFIPTDMQQLQYGIIYTPMAYSIIKKE